MQSNTAYGNKTGSEALYTAEYYFNLFFYHRQTVCFNLKHCCQQFSVILIKKIKKVIKKLFINYFVTDKK